MHDGSAGFSRKIMTLWVVLVASCEDSTPVEVRVTPANSTAPVVSAPVVVSAAPARRPTLRNFLVRTDERCEVFAEDGAEVSVAERVPCPQDLEVGERIRVAGKTCMRDGRPERRRPVVCPGALIAREMRDAGVDAAKP